MNKDRYNDTSELLLNSIYFLRRAPFVIFLFLIKNLLLLTNYFPTFGVLFYTIEKAKIEVMSFFLMASTFFIGFTVAGHILFGK